MSARRRSSREGLSSSSEYGDTKDSATFGVKTPSGTSLKSPPPDKTATSTERSDVVVTVSTPMLTEPTKVVTSSVTSDIATTAMTTAAPAAPTSTPSVLSDVLTTATATVSTSTPSGVPKVVTFTLPSERTKTTPMLDSSVVMTTAVEAMRPSTSVSTSLGTTRLSTSMSTSLEPSAPTETTSPALTVLSPAAPVFVPASSVPTPLRTGGPPAPVLCPPAVVAMTTPRGFTGGPGPPCDVMSETVTETFSRFLKVQTDAIAAQTKATAVQNLPALATYSGENEDVDGDGFEQWLEMFKERAAFAGWSDSEQLYQLKLHLTRNALEIFRMLPPEEQTTINTVQRR